MYVGHLKTMNFSANALIITIEGTDLRGRGDRKVFLPKSQIEIKTDPINGYTIYIPDWLIIKNRVNWCRITEIEPIEPSREAYKRRYLP